MKSAIHNVPPTIVRPLQLLSLSPVTTTPYPSPKSEPDSGQQQKIFEQQFTDLNLMRAHIEKLGLENPDFQLQSKLIISGLYQDIGFALGDLQANLNTFGKKTQTKGEVAPPVEVWYLQEIFNRYVNLIAEINAKPRSVLLFFSVRPKRPRLSEHGDSGHILTHDMLSEAASEADVTNRIHGMSLKT